MVKQKNLNLNWKQNPIRRGNAMSERSWAIDRTGEATREWDKKEHSHTRKLYDYFFSSEKKKSQVNKFYLVVIRLSRVILPYCCTFVSVCFACWFVLVTYRKRRHIIWIGLVSKQSNEYAFVYISISLFLLFSAVCICVGI